MRTQDDLLSDDTICPDARLDGGVTMYDAHNLYGWSQAGATLEAVRAATGERGFVITRLVVSLLFNSI